MNVWCIWSSQRVQLGAMGLTEVCGRAGTVSRIKSGELWRRQLHEARGREAPARHLNGCLAPSAASPPNSQCNAVPTPGRCIRSHRRRAHAKLQRGRGQVRCALRTLRVSRYSRENMESTHTGTVQIPNRGRNALAVSPSPEAAQHNTQQSADQELSKTPRPPLVWSWGH